VCGLNSLLGYGTLWRLAVATVFLTAAALPGGAVMPSFREAGQDKVTVSLETVVRHWRNWQASIRTARFTWKDTIVTPKGVVLSDTMSKEVNPRGVNVPAEDSTRENITTLILDGANWRYEHLGHVIDGRTGNVVPEHTTAVSKDGNGRVYMPKGVYDHPLGNITRLKKEDIPRDLTAKPLFLLLRSLSVGLFKVEDYAISALKGHVEGGSCVIVQGKQTDPNREAYWVDPAKDCAIMRYTISNQERVLVKMDLYYARSAEHGLVPARWHIVSSDMNGKTTESTSAFVVDYAINVPMDPRLFELEFPPGTLVRDFTAPSDFESASRWIVRDDGEKRYVTPHERTASYEQLINSESGQALVAPVSNVLGTWWLVALNIAVFVVALTLIVRRRLRTKIK
jgi:hypothetical protein